MVQESAIINASNIFIQVHSNIYNLINNRSNVPDPNDSTGNRKFVYTREPLKLGAGFKGYPFILVPDPEDYNQSNKTADASKANTFDSITISIFAKDKNSDSDGDPVGRETVASITSNVVYTINSNHASLRENGLKNIEIDSSDFDWLDEEGQAVFRRDLVLKSNQIRRIT